MPAALVIILLLTTLLAPLPAVALDRFDGNVSGRVSFGYNDYQSDDSRWGEVDANSFSQYYSLLYRGQGYLNGGRGGTYKFALGAEYAAFSSSINDQEKSVDTIKPLYNGELLIAPGGLPFRLRLYCNDLQQTSFVTEEPEGFGENILPPGVVTDVLNGTHRRTGATLLIGIKNGAYLGQYRDTLSKFPRLLADYSEIEEESKHSSEQIHYLQRDLAFVSLNKKDNWFHYRVRTFRDFLQPDGSADTYSTSYILGTIDPILNRAWINLTNWIKVSADGTFSKELSGQGATQTTEESYALNLFAVARRAGGKASTYSTYRRIFEDDTSLDTALSVPLFVDQQINRDIAYRAQFAYDRTRDSVFMRGEENFEDLYAFVRTETRQSRSIVVAPEVGLETFTGDHGAGQALQAGIEAYTNRRFRPAVDWKLRYATRYFTGEDAQANAVDYLEQELSGRFNRRVGARWRIGGEEMLLFGSGDMGSSFGSRITARTTSGQMYSSSGNSARSGNVMHSKTTLYGEHGSGSRLENRLQLTLDYLDVDGDGNLQSGLGHELRYRHSRTMSYSMSNTLSLGEGQTGNTGGLGGELAAGSRGAPEQVFRHSSLWQYLPDRRFDSRLQADFLWKDGDGWSSTETIVSQKLRYNYYRVNGLVRKLAEVEESLVYERIGNGSIYSSLATFILAGRYNPTATTFLRARFSYETHIESGLNTLTGLAGCGLQYPKLAISLDYAYGERAAGDDVTMSDRNEQRIQVRVDKPF